MDFEVNYMAGMAVVVGVTGAVVKHYLSRRKGILFSKTSVDDELIVDELTADVIKNWHNRYKREIGCVTVLLAPVGKNIRLFNMVGVKREEYDNSMLQGLYDEKRDEVLRVRLIGFKSIDIALKKKLDEHKGTLVLEE